VSRRGCKHGVEGGGVEEIELKKAVIYVLLLTRRSFNLHFAYPVLPVFSAWGAVFSAQKGRCLIKNSYSRTNKGIAVE